MNAQAENTIFSCLFYWVCDRNEFKSFQFIFFSALSISHSWMVLMTKSCEFYVINNPNNQMTNHKWRLKSQKKNMENMLKCLHNSFELWIKWTGATKFVLLEILIWIIYRILFFFSIDSWNKSAQKSLIWRIISIVKV